MSTRRSSFAAEPFSTADPPMIIVCVNLCIRSQALSGSLIKRYARRNAYNSFIRTSPILTAGADVSQQGMEPIPTSIIVCFNVVDPLRINDAERYSEQLRKG